MPADPDCLFCKIIAGELVRGRSSTRTNCTVSFMDIYPVTRGHALVVPRNHSRDLHRDRRRGPRRDGLAAQRLAARARDALGADGVNLTQLQRACSVADRLPLPPARDPSLRRTTRCGSQWLPGPGDPDEIAAAAELLRGGPDADGWMLRGVARTSSLRVRRGS